MGKAGRQRRLRQEGDPQRRRAAGSPGPGPQSGPRRVPSQQEQIASAIAGAVQAVCDGRPDVYDKQLEQLAIERAPGWTQVVSRTLAEYLRLSVASAWKRGWQPAELARQAGRELSAAHAAVVSDMITAEMLGYA